MGLLPIKPAEVLLSFPGPDTKVVGRYGIRFENSLTREEEDILRQWIGTHTWGYITGSLYRFVEGGGKTCPDPCRLYFEKRDDYYRQEVDSFAVPAPKHNMSAASQVEPGPPEEAEDSKT